VVRLARLGGGLPRRRHGGDEHRGPRAARAADPGDVEITQFAIALALSLGLPWCQWRRANIIVDFFTQKLDAAVTRRLDAAGCLLVAAMCALLAWRTGAGALAVREAGETTMVLALPMWWIYAALATGPRAHGADRAAAGLAASSPAGRRPGRRRMRRSPPR